MKAGWCGVAGSVLVAICCGVLASSASAQSITDRIKGLFGSPSAPAASGAPAADENDLTCPGVSIRPGASTLAVGLPGKPASGSDLRYQGTITRTARDCTLLNNQVTGRIGIEGRVIVGPAGAPSQVDIPLRVAVVQEGIQQKTIFTQVYRIPVSIPPEQGSVPFSFVAEDVIYPAPAGAVADLYVFYIGFDPDGLKNQPRAKPAKQPRGN